MGQCETSSEGRIANPRISRIAASLQEMVKIIQDATELAARQQHLHPTDFRCLTYLDEVGGAASPKAIIGHLGLTSGAGTALLDRLEGRGYVTRQANPDDRRGVVIRLDQQTAKTLLATHEATKQRFHALIARLQPDQIETVGDFLDDVLDIAKLQVRGLQQAQ
ncbi:MAG: MarR family winged helix-turn-helix transcriptional regulator [Devosia sp.]